MAQSGAVVLARLPSRTTAPPSAAIERLGWLAKVACKLNVAAAAISDGAGAPTKIAS
ncbi:hypothetical protein [Aeromonas veronii]|uniref:hypothetical protein n=1 Tax=Aeromonas veronii TaxID=654 RepID=UPI001F18D4F3|nr:hypothetical protein [Aeromonas veronii]